MLSLIEDGETLEDVIDSKEFLETQVKKGKLSIQGLRKYSDQTICNIYKVLKRSSIKITESFIYGISGPYRKQLIIPYCNGIKASSLNYLFFNSPNLEVVDLSNCYQVNNRVVRCIISNCNKLKELNISGCKLVTDSAFKTELFSPVKSSLCNLKSLIIENCCQIIDLHNVIKHSVGLEVLNISSCRNITLGTLEDIVQCCVNLKELDISSCDGINDGSCEFNCSINNSIEKITISRSKLSSKILEKIVSSFTKLKFLDLKFNINMNDEVFKRITLNLKDLETLKLKNCANISDKSFYYLDKNLKKLQHLDISWCPLLTSTTIKYLALRYSEDDVCRLKTLKLSQSTNLGMNFNPHKCMFENSNRIKIPKLTLNDDETLDNHYSDDNSILQLVETNKSELFVLEEDIIDDKVLKLIQDLEIETKLVGGGLTPLSMCCIIKSNSDSLVDLELDGLKNVITSDLIHYIGTYCINLKNLSISIYELSDLLIDSFKEVCTNCRNIEKISLDISYIKSIKYQSLILECLIGDCCLLNLKELILISNSGLGFSGDCFDIISSGKFRPYKLVINNLQSVPRGYFVDNEIKLKSFFSNITELSFSVNDTIDDKELVFLLNNMNNISSLEIINFNGLSRDFPIFVWENYPKIKHLNINDKINKVFLERF
ncbi:LRR protein [Cryptosporidium xiaoi]|uniref:LRR protein n=1 Tax=Cryptosporidium xiaoi TaxID=659607 RepID=A0AAV9XXY9_9CRYT